MESCVSVVFPGQGAQRAGMGKDFYEEIPHCREVYEEAADALGWDVAALCFQEDERLNQTAYTQPCILTTEVAMYRGIEERYGFSARFFGGHSLGEYTALVVAGVLPLAAAVVIVEKRGRLMQEAVPLGMGAMAAVISPYLEDISLGELLCDLPVDIANVNSKEQVVISGLAASLPEAEERIRAALEAKGGLRIVPLNVSAPFHSRFMRPIEERFFQVLAGHRKDLKAEAAPSVTANFTGSFHGDCAEELLGCLVSQVSHTVRWRENMEALAAQGGEIYEIGPSRVLRGFFASLGLACTSITTLAAAAKVLGK